MHFSYLLEIVALFLPNIKYYHFKSPATQGFLIQNYGQQLFTGNPMAILARETSMQSSDLQLPSSPLNGVPQSYPHPCSRTPALLSLCPHLQRITQNFSYILSLHTTIISMTKTYTDSLGNLQPEKAGGLSSDPHSPSMSNTTVSSPVLQQTNCYGLPFYRASILRELGGASHPAFHDLIDLFNIPSSSFSLRVSSKHQET